MKIQGQRLKHLFSQNSQVSAIEKNESHFKKKLCSLEVDLKSLRGFFSLGAISESTQNLLCDIHGPQTEKPCRELLMTLRQTQSYLNKPTYFMGPKEHFIIAINLAFHYRDSINYYDRRSSYFLERSLKAGFPCSVISADFAKPKIIKKFFNIVQERLYEDPTLENTLKLYKGIKHFDEARECRTFNKTKSNDLLKEAKIHFVEIIKEDNQNITAITFIGLIDALLGRVESALGFLLKAADNVFNPRLIYRLMSKLFNVLKMKRASKFYKRKSFSGTKRMVSSIPNNLKTILIFKEEKAA